MNTVEMRYFASSFLVKANFLQLYYPQKSSRVAFNLKNGNSIGMRNHRFFLKNVSKQGKQPNVYRSQEIAFEDVLSGAQTECVIRTLKEQQKRKQLGKQQRRGSYEKFILQKINVVLKVKGKQKMQTLMN